MSSRQGSSTALGSTHPFRKHTLTVPVLSFNEPGDLTAYSRVQRACGAAPNVIVVCGAGISTSAGIPDFRSAHGLYQEFPSVPGKKLLGPEMFDARTLRDAEKLLDYGRAMGALRMACQKAKPTVCHEYIAELHERGRLVRCYTQNIDGLQTFGRPHLAKVVLELHGNIHRLSCSRCGQSPDHSSTDTDRRLLEDGHVQCEKCQERGKVGTDRRWDLRPLQPGLLLPRVLHNEGSWEIELDGVSMNELEAADGSASLLLVLGTSIKTDGAAKLIRSLAKRVHKNGGIVVYVDRQLLRDGKWVNYFDLQLQTELDVWAQEALCSLNEEQLDIRAEIVDLIEQMQSRHPTNFLYEGREFSRNRDLRLGGAASLLARAMALAVSEMGVSRGWVCHAYMVVLNESADLNEIPVWEGHQLIVVHISDYVFRIHNNWRLTEPGQRPRELLERSVNTMHKLSTRSNGQLILLLCSEDELLNMESLGELQDAFHQQSTFSTMMTSLNLCQLLTHSWSRLALNAILSNMPAQSSYIDRIVTSWASDKELMHSSDLVLFSHAARTTMLLASNFADCPLGKPLPDVNLTCPCNPMGMRTGHKAWQVDHNAVDGCAARMVRLTVQCSACCRSWNLNTSELAGMVRNIQGEFCLLLSYEGECGWV